MAWTNPIDYSVGQATCIARIDEMTLGNIIFSSSHLHSGTAGDGAVIRAGSSLGGKSSTGLQTVYQYLTNHPFFPSASTGTWARGVATAVNGIVYNTSAACGNKLDYDVDVDKGTWTLSFMYGKSSGQGTVSGGSITVYIIQGAGTSNIGGLDTYQAGGNAYNYTSSASTFTVGASGIYTIRFEVTNRNSSSSGYKLALQHFELRRLSA